MPDALRADPAARPPASPTAPAAARRPPPSRAAPAARVRPGYGVPSPVDRSGRPPPVAPARVSEAVLKIPLGTRELVRQSLDLLTRRDSGLRRPVVLHRVHPARHVRRRSP